MNEQFKNQKKPDKGKKSCTTTEYVTVTIEMCQNILLPSFKGEHPIPTYYLLPANIYGLGINDASNNICPFHTWIEFEVKKGMNNIASCILCWINAKGYY